MLKNWASGVRILAIGSKNFGPRGQDGRLITNEAKGWKRTDLKVLNDF